MHARPGRIVPWWALAAWVLVLLLALHSYPALPRRMAFHYTPSGRVDVLLPRPWALIALPGLSLLAIVLWWLISAVGRDLPEPDAFWPLFRLLGGLVPLFFAALELLLLAAALAPGPSLRVGGALVGLLLVGLAGLAEAALPGGLGLDIAAVSLALFTTAAAWLAGSAALVWPSALLSLLLLLVGRRRA